MYIFNVRIVFRSLMKEIIISENEAGQRFDKYLDKYFKDAPKSFIYKMLRKKNITRNGKKAEGSEKLIKGDVVKMFLSDDTIEKFRGNGNAYTVSKHVKLDIIYEDNNIIAVNKPVGMLSQKSKPDDESLNEYIIDYLISGGKMDKEDLRTFKPSICNRLDRNTGGIVLAGCSLKGTQALSCMLKDRSLQKYYYCIVNGVMKEPQKIDGYLLKSTSDNHVEIRDESFNGASYIETYYEPIKDNGSITLLKVKLITGKTHQIRAHLSWTGHSIIGDYKYGDADSNVYYRKKYGCSSQLLHAGEVIFPDVKGELSYLSGMKLMAGFTKMFDDILKGEFE